MGQYGAFGFLMVSFYWPEWISGYKKMRYFKNLVIPREQRNGQKKRMADLNQFCASEQVNETVFEFQNETIVPVMVTDENGKSTGLIGVVTRAQARRENLGAMEMAETPEEEENLGAREMAETPEESSDEEDEMQDANLEERGVFPEDGEGNQRVEEPREENGRIFNPQDRPVLPRLLKTETADGLAFHFSPDWLIGFQEGQTEDFFIKSARAFVTGGEMPQDVRKKMTTYLRRMKDQFFINEDDFLVRQEPFRDDQEPKLVVPKVLTLMVMKEFHGPRIAAHPGEHATQKNIGRSFFWPGMHAQISNFVKRCNSCAFYKMPLKMKSPLSPISSSKCFELVCMDIAGPFVESNNENRFVIGFIDHFSNFLVAKATSETSADTIANMYFHDICMVFGISRKLLTDRGRNVSGITIHQLAEILGTDKIETTAYHPRGNGKIERVWRSLGTQLAIYTREHPEDWCKYLLYLVSAHNSTENETTKFSPIEILLGEKPRMPIEYAILPSQRVARGLADVVQDKIARLKQIRKQAKINISEAQRKQKLLYDKKVRHHTFRPGQKVLLKIERLEPGTSRKLAPKFEGPHRIIQLNSKGTTAWIACNMDTEQLDQVSCERLVAAPDENDSIEEEVLENDENNEA